MKKENYLKNIYEIFDIDLPITESKITYYVNYLIEIYGDINPLVYNTSNQNLINYVQKSLDSINNGYNTSLKDNLRGLYYNKIGLDIVHYQHRNIHIIYEDLKYSSYREALKKLK